MPMIHREMWLSQNVQSASLKGATRSKCPPICPAPNDFLPVLFSCKLPPCSLNRVLLYALVVIPKLFTLQIRFCVRFLKPVATYCVKIDLEDFKCFDAL